jgi:hypothetical protein
VRNGTDGIVVEDPKNHSKETAEPKQLDNLQDSSKIFSRFITKLSRNLYPTFHIDPLPSPPFSPIAIAKDFPPSVVREN